MQGTPQGRVIGKLTRETHVEEDEVAASEDEPQYLVESDASGEQVAHKPEALRKRRLA